MRSLGATTGECPPATTKTQHSQKKVKSKFFFEKGKFFYMKQFWARELLAKEKDYF